MFFKGLNRDGIMKIVTTPMCKEILEIIGIKEFKVNKNPDDEKGDLAILISNEKKVKMNSLILKLNTFKQIKESTFEVLRYLDFDELKSEDEIKKFFYEIEKENKWFNKNEREKLIEKNSNIKINVYTIFLKEIVEDMGFKILNLDIFKLDSKKHKEILLDDLISIEKDSDIDFLIFPDYFNINISYLNPNIQDKIIIMPTHNNISKNPIKRAEIRYSILEKL
jgi:hypothetical protein